MTAKFWAVIPAAGSGSRMASSIPKQYLPLLDKTVIEFSLQVLLNHPAIEGCVVVISEHDQHWDSLKLASHPKVTKVIGGQERADSVLAGLLALQERATPDDWVLVHDAARPCLRHEDVDLLINTVSESSCGGILAQPVVETVKQTDFPEIVSTLDRREIYLAQTPQCFNFAELTKGYLLAKQDCAVLTDEASVLERQGKKPIVVPCGQHNMKITHPHDLALATFYLTQGNN